MPSTNAEVIRRWNQENQDPDAVREIVSPDFVAHLDGEDVHGPEEWIAFTQRDDVQLSDVETGIDELIESGSLVGERWWMRGTAGDGTSLSMRGITMHRVEDGRLREDWVVLRVDE